MSQTNRLIRLEQINDVCEQFEAQLLQEQHPQIEDFLDSVVEEWRSELLSELVRVEIFYLMEQGHSPRIQDYQKRFFEFRNGIIQAFDTADDFHEQPTNENSIDPDAVVESRQTGQTVGSFTIEQVLGSGAFAEVFLAFDREHDRPVAIKAMKRMVDKHGQPIPRAVQSFVEESKTLSRLNHEAVAEIYDLRYDEEGFPFVVMEYVKGDSLQFLLREDIVDLPTAIKLLADTAEALSKIHQQDVFHRDLKPANIIVGLDGQPRIVDFGLALSEANQQDRKGEIAGSISHMSPEQLRGQSHRLDGRSDIWSLGVMLYELLAGRLPFRGATRQILIDEILHRDPRPPRQINPDVTVGIEKICLDALKKDSTKRIATAQDFADRLRSELGEFAERLADVSPQRSATAQGRAELRLATQARYWNERPESQRLPTLLQYLNILTRTDSMTRTVAESRMMNAAFWYFTKRIAVVLAGVVLTTMLIKQILQSTAINFVNRDQALQQLVANIVHADTRTEVELYVEKIDDRRKAIPLLLDATAASFEEIEKSAIENCLMALLDMPELFAVMTSAEREHLRQVLRENAESDSVSIGKKQDLIKPTGLLVKTLEDRFGMVEDSFAFCPELTPEEFESFHQQLQHSNYGLASIDIAKDETRIAAIWHRDIEDSPFSGSSFVEIKSQLTNQEPVKFDIESVIFPDYFSGDSGLNGLQDFDMRFESLSNEIDFSNETRFAKQLELSERFVGTRSSMCLFLRARAFYHLGRYKDCLQELNALANRRSAFALNPIFFHYQALVFARLGEREQALASVDKFHAQQSSTGKKRTINTLFLRARVLWHLGDFSPANNWLSQDPGPVSQLKMRSIMADSLAEAGKIESARREIEAAKAVIPDIKLLTLLAAESQYFREQVPGFWESSDSEYLPLFSGKWDFESPVETRFTSGKAKSFSYAHAPDRHWQQCIKYARDGFIPTKIKIYQAPAEDLFRVASIWSKQDQSVAEPPPNIEIRALAIAGEIKLQSMTRDAVDLQLFDALKDSEDRTSRTELMDCLRRLNPDIPSGILAALGNNQDPATEQALVCTLALLDRNRLDAHRDEIFRAIDRLSQNNKDAGVESAIILLNKKMDRPGHSNGSKKTVESNWTINRIGQRLIRQGDLWFATTEVTETEFDIVMQRSRPGDHNQAHAGVSFYEAARFCNRLSKLEGIPADQWCYLRNQQGIFASGMTVKPGFQELAGYRMPTTDEWKAAYRSGAKSTWEHGENVDQVGLFSRILNHNRKRGAKRDLGVATRLPNRLGLFDMGGNISEWLTPISEQPITDESNLTLFGGNYRLTANNARDAATQSNPIPVVNFKNGTGIRLVRRVVKSESSKKPEADHESGTWGSN